MQPSNTTPDWTPAGAVFDCDGLLVDTEPCWTVAEIGVTPVDAVAFEDSVTGLRAAQAAGMRTVGIPTLPHPKFPADYTVTSLTCPALATWVAGW